MGFPGLCGFLVGFRIFEGGVGLGTWHHTTRLIKETKKTKTQHQRAKAVPNSVKLQHSRSIRGEVQRD